MLWHKVQGAGGLANFAWDLANAAYDSISFNLSTQLINPNGMVFKPDGTKMYVLCRGNKTVYQYSLSNAWNIGTASYDSASFGILSQDAAPTDLYIKSDGTKMYICGAGNDNVYSYSLSTAWDITTASYDSVSLNVRPQEEEIQGIFFKPDGTKLYTLGQIGDSAYQYSLSTAWDLSSASYDSVSFSVSAQDGNPSSLLFKPDGTKMFLSGADSDSVYQYSLSTAWDLSGASYDSLSFSVSSQETNPRALSFRADGKVMYVAGNATDTAYQYAL